MTVLILLHPGTPPWGAKRPSLRLNSTRVRHGSDHDASISRVRGLDSAHSQPLVEIMKTNLALQEVQGIYLVLIMVFTPPESQINSPVSPAASQKLLYVTSAMNLDISGPTAPTGLKECLPLSMLLTQTTSLP